VSKITVLDCKTLESDDDSDSSRSGSATSLYSFLSEFLVGFVELTH